MLTQHQQGYSASRDPNKLAWHGCKYHGPFGTVECGSSVVLLTAVQALLGAQAHALRDAVPCFEFTNAPPVAVTPQRPSPVYGCCHHTVLSLTAAHSPRTTGGQASASPANSSMVGNVFTKEVTKQQHADAELYALTRLRYSLAHHLPPFFLLLLASDAIAQWATAHRAAVVRSAKLAPDGSCVWTESAGPVAALLPPRHY